MKTFPFLFLCLFIIWACGTQTDENLSEVNGPGLAETNPAAEGFDAEGSDAEAIAIADKVMEAMGGRNAWDSTRYISWNFFGRRSLLWDKKTGNVRIDVPGDSAIYLVNVSQDTGRVMLRGQEVVEKDSLDKYIEQGKKIWVNDSYWLVMPYKLKDTGVTLSYMGEDTTLAGEEADVLELRFQNVGFTPQNKYEVYVTKDDNLVKQWAYYSEAELDTPNFNIPWQNYQEYNGILLSGDRGGERRLSEINVYDSIPQQDAYALQPFSFN